MFDNEKLSPAPWVFDNKEQCAAIYVGPIVENLDELDKVIAYVQDRAWERNIKQHTYDWQFIADARNAYAAQMEYGWTAVCISIGLYKGCWTVKNMSDEDDRGFREHITNVFPNPVTALACAYKWKKK